MWARRRWFGCLRVTLCSLDPLSPPFFRSADVEMSEGDHGDLEGSEVSASQTGDGDGDDGDGEDRDQALLGSGPRVALRDGISSLLRLLELLEDTFPRLGRRQGDGGGIEGGGDAETQRRAWSALQASAAQLCADVVGGSVASVSVVTPLVDRCGKSGWWKVGGVE